MEDNVKKILYRQLELLVERSKFKNISVNELTQLNKEIVNLAHVLLEIQTQFQKISIYEPQHHLFSLFK